MQYLSGEESIRANPRIHHKCKICTDINLKQTDSHPEVRGYSIPYTIKKNDQAAEEQTIPSTTNSNITICKSRNKDEQPKKNRHHSVVCTSDSCSSSGNHCDIGRSFDDEAVRLTTGPRDNVVNICPWCPDCRSGEESVKIHVTPLTMSEATRRCAAVVEELRRGSASNWASTELVMPVSPAEDKASDKNGNLTTENSISHQSSEITLKRSDSDVSQDQISVDCILEITPSEQCNRDSSSASEITLSQQRSSATVILESVEHNLSRSSPPLNSDRLGPSVSYTIFPKNQSSVERVAVSADFDKHDATTLMEFDNSLHKNRGQPKSVRDRIVSKAQKLSRGAYDQVSDRISNGGAEKSQDAKQHSEDIIQKQEFIVPSVTSSEHSKHSDNISLKTDLFQNSFGDVHNLQDASPLSSMSNKNVTGGRKLKKANNGVNKFPQKSAFSMNPFLSRDEEFSLSELESSVQVSEIIGSQVSSDQNVNADYLFVENTGLLSSLSADPILKDGTSFAALYNNGKLKESYVAKKSIPLKYIVPSSSELSNLPQHDTLQLGHSTAGLNSKNVNSKFASILSPKPKIEFRLSHNSESRTPASEESSSKELFPHKFNADDLTDFGEKQIDIPNTDNVQTQSLHFRISIRATQNVDSSSGEEEEDCSKFQQIHHSKSDGNNEGCTIECCGTTTEPECMSEEFKTSRWFPFSTVYENNSDEEYQNCVKNKQECNSSDGSHCAYSCRTYCCTPIEEDIQGVTSECGSDTPCCSARGGDVQEMGSERIATPLSCTSTKTDIANHASYTILRKKNDTIDPCHSESTGCTSTPDIYCNTVGDRNRTDISEQPSDVESNPLSDKSCEIVSEEEHQECVETMKQCWSPCLSSESHWQRQRGVSCDTRNNNVISSETLRNNSGSVDNSLCYTHQGSSVYSFPAETRKFSTDSGIISMNPILTLTSNLNDIKDRQMKAKKTSKFLDTDTSVDAFEVSPDIQTGQLCSVDKSRQDNFCPVYNHCEESDNCYEETEICSSDDCSALEQCNKRDCCVTNVPGNTHECKKSSNRNKTNASNGACEKKRIGHKTPIEHDHNDSSSISASVVCSDTSTNPELFDDALKCTVARMRKQSQNFIEFETRDGGRNSPSPSRRNESGESRRNFPSSPRRNESRESERNSPSSSQRNESRKSGRNSPSPSRRKNFAEKCSSLFNEADLDYDALTALDDDEASNDETKLYNKSCLKTGRGKQESFEKRNNKRARISRKENEQDENIQCFAMRNNNSDAVEPVEPRTSSILKSPRNSSNRQDSKSTEKLVVNGCQKSNNESQPSFVRERSYNNKMMELCLDVKGSDVSVDNQLLTYCYNNYTYVITVY